MVGACTGEKRGVGESKLTPSCITKLKVKLLLTLDNQYVIFDTDLAELYGVETKVLNQAVTRNKDRFPEDFMFRLTKEEYAVLRSQFMTSRWGGTRYPPRAFTEHGILMLSNVLKSERAVQVEYPNNPSFQ